MATRKGKPASSKAPADADGPIASPPPPASNGEGGSQGDKPQPSASPTEISVEGPARQQIVGLAITNQGGGQLQADVAADQPWIAVDPSHISENHVKIEVSIDLSKLPPEQVQSGEVSINGSDYALKVPVRATRFGIERACKQYLENHPAEARETCRQLLQGDATNPDASLVMAGAYLDEGNAPAAMRSMQDSTEAPRALSDDVVKRLLQSLRTHADQLKELDYGIPVLERLSQSCSEALQQPVEEALHQTYTRALQARLASTAPDLDRLTALLEAARARFPDDPEWAALQARFPEKPAAEPAVTPPTRGWLATMGVGLLAIPLTLAVLFLGMPAYELKQGQAALSRQDWQGALDWAERVLYWNSESADAKKIRATANSELAQVYFRADSEELAQGHLRAALSDSAADPGLAKREIDYYAHWAENAEKRGRYNLAVQDYQVVHSLAPKNTKAVDAIKRLQTVGELCSLLSTFHAVKDRTMVPLDVTPNPPTGMPARLTYSNFGLKWFEKRMQVLSVDLDGDGRDEIVIGGSDNDQHGGVVIYQCPPADGKVKFPKLQAIQGFNVGPAGYLDRLEVIAQQNKTIVVSRFLSRMGAPGGHMFFVWFEGHKGTVWEASRVDAATADAAAVWAKRPKT